MYNVWAKTEWKSVWAACIQDTKSTQMSKKTELADDIQSFH